MNEQATRTSVPPVVEHDAAQQALARLGADQQPLALQMTKLDGFLLMSTLQLVCRHPEFRKTDVYRQMRTLALEIQTAITGNDEVLRRLAEMGWHAEYDT